MMKLIPIVFLSLLIGATATAVAAAPASVGLDSFGDDEQAEQSARYRLVDKSTGAVLVKGNASGTGFNDQDAATELGKHIARKIGLVDL